MSCVSLVGVFLSQIKQANFLGQSSGFRRLLLQDPSIRALIYLLAPYIIGSKIDMITTNPRLWLASHDMNPEALKDFSFKIIQIL